MNASSDHRASRRHEKLLPMETPKYRYIDGMRGWAILLVLLIHSALGIVAIRSLDAFDPTLRPDIDLPQWLKYICDDSGHGVQLFFVVSAASLTLSCLKRGGIDLGPYILRRFFRIAPMFYLGLIFYMVIFGFGSRMWAPSGISAADVFYTFSFIHIGFQNAMNSVVPGGWSIGNEAAFYFFLPFLFLMMKHSMKLFYIAAAMLFILVQLRFCYLMYSGKWSGFAFLGFANQAPVFVFGMIAGYHVYMKKQIEWLNSTIASTALFFVMLFLLPQARVGAEIIQPHVRFAAMAAILFVALQQDSSFLFTNRIMVWIGKISFSIYIIHFIMLEPSHFLAAQITNSRDFYFLFISYTFLVCLSGGVAFFTYNLIELPFMRLAARMSISNPLDRLIGKAWEKKNTWRPMHTMIVERAPEPRDTSSHVAHKAPAADA